MTKQLMIYERATPLSSARHRDWSVAPAPEAFGFAREVNSAPLVAAEMLLASREYAIVFAGEGDAIMPSAIFGVRTASNVFVGKDGAWEGRYVPAFLRRYPFVFSRSADGANFTLCIDEEYEGLNQEGRGERLFDSSGERTQYLQSILNFVTEYQTQFNATQRFCKKLKDLDLLEPAQAQFRLPDGESASLTGFMTVNRDKLKALADDAMLGMAKTDELELVHAHLASLSNITPVAERAAKAEGAAAATNGAAAPAQETETA